MDSDAMSGDGQSDRTVVQVVSSLLSRSFRFSIVLRFTQLQGHSEPRCRIRCHCPYEHSSEAVGTSNTEPRESEGGENEEMSIQVESLMEAMKEEPQMSVEKELEIKHT